MERNHAMTGLVESTPISLIPQQRPHLWPPFPWWDRIQTRKLCPVDVDTQKTSWIFAKHCGVYEEVVYLSDDIHAEIRERKSPIRTISHDRKSSRMKNTVPTRWMDLKGHFEINYLAGLNFPPSLKKGFLCEYNCKPGEMNSTPRFRAWFQFQIHGDQAESSWLIW